MAEDKVITVAKALFAARHPADDWNHMYGWFQEAMKSEAFKESQLLAPSHIMSAVFRDAVVAVNALK